MGPLLTLAEAALFLRKSKSWLYQNRSIPRYRPPGSRSFLYDQAELLAWVKGRGVTEQRPARSEEGAEPRGEAVALSSGMPYHRNPRYR